VAEPAQPPATVTRASLCFTCIRIRQRLFLNIWPRGVRGHHHAYIAIQDACVGVSTNPDFPGDAGNADTDEHETEEADEDEADEDETDESGEDESDDEADEADAKPVAKG
jgi:hypothetical protein